MADDSVLYAISALGGVFLLIAVFYIARLFDSDFRCREMRKWIKKNYVIVARVQKNRATINKTIINADADVVFDKNRLWASVQGKLYTTVMNDELPIHKLIDEAVQKSEPIDLKKETKWEAGTPIIYVDSDSMIPLTFHKQEAQVKPDEVGAGINAWNAVQKAEMLADMNQDKILTYAIIIMCAGAVIFGFVNYGILDEMNTRQKGMATQINVLVPPSMNLSNGSITINQPKVASNGR